MRLTMLLGNRFRVTAETDEEENRLSILQKGMPTVIESGYSYGRYFITLEVLEQEPRHPNLPEKM